MMKSYVDPTGQTAMTKKEKETEQAEEILR